MKKYRVWAVILPFCLTTGLAACVTTEKMPAADNAAAAQMNTQQSEKAAALQPETAAAPGAKNQKLAASAPKPPPPPADPCVATVDQLAEQARTGMKTYTGTCQDQRIGVNPMWAKNYDGAVRVRIYDASGKMKSMETLDSKDHPENPNK